MLYYVNAYLQYIYIYIYSTFVYFLKTTFLTSSEPAVLLFTVLIVCVWGTREDKIAPTRIDNIKYARKLLLTRARTYLCTE